MLLTPAPDSPPLQPGAPLALVDGQFRLCVPLPFGQVCVLEGSSNLEDWVPLTTLFVAGGLLEFADPEAVKLPQRFYRAVPLH